MEGYKVLILITLIGCMLLLSYASPFQRGPEQYSNMFQFHTTAKRKFNERKRTELLSQGENLPWDCGMEPIWTDLGENHHPRHIREVQCLNTTCWNGFYQCVPQLYNVKVLIPNIVGDIDGKIPAALRTEWSFRDVSVTVGCMCQR